MSFQTVVDFVVDTLFPPRCPWCDRVVGHSLGCSCEKERAALELPPGPITWFSLEDWVLGDVYAVYRYKSPVREGVLRLKGAGDQKLAGPYGARMSLRAAELELNNQFDCVIPAPISPKSMKKRGFNQSALLAKAVAKQLGLPLDESALAKTKETVPQRTLARQERLTNVQGVYEAREGVKGKRVLLVDDVVTTGSTLNECAQTLLAAGAASCCALCLAATEKGEDGPETEA